MSTGLANMVKINAGTFMMGSIAGEAQRFDNEGPQHPVTVSSFYISMHHVTQKEYEELMETNPSHFQGANLPVENVSWFEAAEYCNRLSQREGLKPAYEIENRRMSASIVTWHRNIDGYRLPTEAEWEYACRAGTTTPFYTGNNITTGQANYNGKYPYNRNKKGENRKTSTPVKMFPPNSWGLYDMHGNVWEWCWDYYDHYTADSQSDPTGPEDGTVRVMRGGSWDDVGQTLRSALRNANAPGHRDSHIGFRVVRQVKQGMKK